MRKKLISFILTFSIITSAFNFASLNSNALQNESELHSFNKITPELAEIIECNPETELPVVIWLNEISYEEVENSIKAEIGYNLDNLEIDYPTPSDELIDELAKAADGVPDEYLTFLMENHMNLTESMRNFEKKRTDLYRKTRISVLKELNVTASENVINKLGIGDEKIGYVSSFAPMIVCKMTVTEIQTACELTEVCEIDDYVPIEGAECLTDFGTTKATVGIEQINAILGLSGSDVNIGIYETCTLSSQYYSEYGINPSHVTIVGAPYTTGYWHSTYCAGIAAGSNGIAPSAHIKSATCEYDWQSFDWNNYNNAQLSNLEGLINDGVDVISISWGSDNGDDCYNYWTKYIDYLIADTSTTIVCATGNKSLPYILSPSSAYNCIAVNGFVDAYNNQAQELLNDYSFKHGNGCFKPDVIGPSLNRGTSTATPYVAGMIALMYQYKPSLAASPELTKAILLGSCHRKCNKLLSENAITNLSETMEQGITNRQGAGIPDMYRMISMISQHTYGHGVLNSGNGYEQKVKIVQPAYNSSNINISMAYLQTNVPSGSTSGDIDDCDLSVKNNNTTSFSSNSNSSTEMIYKALTSDSDYEIDIYQFSGESTNIRYGYAWSTDKERFVNNYGEEGCYYLKNYKSALYLSRNNQNQAVQTTYSNSFDNLWVLDSLALNSNSYTLKNASILSSGLGLGVAISSTNYYALEGNGASVSSITVTYDTDTGTYTFKRTVNGSTYALGINGQATSSGAYANWSPYSANNNSQKWYLETANYRSGDVDCNGIIQEADRLAVLQHVVNPLVFTNNIQTYLADVNKDNIINVSDAVLIGHIIAEL